jgi:hypothetical protein
MRENENQPTKVLEQVNGQRMDAGRGELGKRS